ncbi:aminoglycoside 6-adenylyltransferase [Campylobacter jejuni]|nr:aminoglycoside 6-adenylyltransferase [Campylobacter jejuni]
MQNQEKILRKIKNFALSCEQIRLATLEGSRVNKKAKKINIKTMIFHFS